MNHDAIISLDDNFDELITNSKLDRKPNEE